MRTAFFLLLAACGSTAPPVFPGKDAGAEQDGFTPPGGDEGDMAQGPLHGGWVFLSSSTVTINATDYSSSSANASFWQANGPLPQGGCTTTSSGACTLTECPPANTDAGTPQPVTPPTAGNITISGGKRTVTLSPKADGSYPTEVDSMKALYAGGETLTVSAAGAQVPAFSTTLTAPARIKVSTMPPTSITRSAGFPIAWSGGNTGEVTLGLYAGTSWITCSAPATSGSAVIPGTLLGKLPAGAATYNAILRAAKHLDASTWSIDFWAYQTVLASSGQGFAGQATLH
jgi:hypothetical protein